MSFVVIIPARFASTRLPGKPLQDINGKPMIVMFWNALANPGPSGLSLLPTIQTWPARWKPPAVKSA